MIGVMLGFFQDRADMNVFDGIKNLIAVPMERHQTRIAQAPQVMRYRGRRSIYDGGYFVNAPFALSQRKNNFGAREIRERLKNASYVMQLGFGGQNQIALLHVAMGLTLIERRG